MIIYKIIGGFASQVYKFIIGYQLAKKINTELVLDLSDYYNGYFRPYALCYLNLPNVKYVYGREATRLSAFAFKIKNNDDMEYILKNGNKSNYYIDIENVLFNDFLSKHKDIDVTLNSQLVKELKPVYDLNFINKFRFSLKENSVAIHIRRGDFCNIGWNEDVTYYKAAIGYFINKLKTPNFYFFSNDLDWVYKHFGFDDSFHYVSSTNGFYGDIEVFYAMSLCEYRVLTSMSGYGMLANIISNSQFNGKYAIISESKNTNKDSGGFNLNDALKYDIDRGNIVTLCGSELNEGLETFNKVFKYLSINNTCSIKISSDSEMLDAHFYCDNVFQKILQRRIVKYRNNNNYFMYRECLETYDEHYLSYSNVVDYWNEIYKEAKTFENKILNIHDIFIFIDKYFINGYSRLFRIYSRLGYEIRVNTKNISEGERAINGIPIAFSYHNNEFGKMKLAIGRRYQKFIYKILNFIYRIGLINNNYIRKNVKFLNTELINSPIEIYDLLDKYVIEKLDISKYTN